MKEVTRTETSASGGAASRSNRTDAINANPIDSQKEADQRQACATSPEIPAHELSNGAHVAPDDSRGVHEPSDSTDNQEEHSVSVSPPATKTIVSNLSIKAATSAKQQYKLKNSITATPDLPRAGHHASQANPRREPPHLASLKTRSKSDNDKPSFHQSGPIVLVDRSEHSGCPRISKPHATASVDSDDDDQENEHTIRGVAVVSVDLSIRFGRLSLGAAIAVAGIVTFAIFMNRGWELARFDSKSKDEESRINLLDDYNSYTGNIATVLTTPIEPFVTLAVQVVVIRVLRSFMLRENVGQQLDLLTLALTSGAVFLITNSFNALNVQLRPLEIQLKIVPEDLVYVANVNASIAARTSTFNQTFSERSPLNPITNTVLRNLVLPRIAKQKPECSWTYAGIDSLVPVPDTVLEYGFIQRDWQSRLLQEAIEPKTIRTKLDAADGSLNPRVNASELPMGISTAADLVVTSLFTLERMFFTNLIDIHSTLGGLPVGFSGSFARAMDILPPVDSHLADAGLREFFLDACMNQTKAIFREAENTSSDATIEFSHVDISETVAFNAFSIEFEVDPLLQYRTTPVNSTTWSTQITKFTDCLQTSATCMLPKTSYPAFSLTYDVQPQVQVFAPCINSNGTEELRIRRSIFGWEQECGTISKSSLMVVSIGKRLVANSLESNSDLSETEGANAVATNLRKIYTLTIGKLSWTVTDLSSHFHATCSEGAAACLGLRFRLSDTSPNAGAQELIVGADALPMDLFFPHTLDSKPRYLPLVRVHEPFRDATGQANQLYDVFAGEPLMLHNVETLVWNATHVDRQDCLPILEERLTMVLNNHMYIEHGLQTAYTAATFFLLQNGVVKDIIMVDKRRQSLDFENNSRSIAVFASIPDQNAWFTIAGCVLLVASIGAVMTWSWTTSRLSKDAGDWTEFATVTAPHVVARVMLDSEHFPDAFLDRRVRLPDDEYSKSHSLDGFIIQALALRQVQVCMSSGKRLSTVRASAHRYHQQTA